MLKVGDDKQRELNMFGMFEMQKKRAQRTFKTHV